jgi:hypothetical protein
MIKRVTAVLAATAAVFVLGGLAGASGAAAPRSCGSFNGFSNVTAAGVTCHYATRTFIAQFAHRGKVLPRGWKCIYRRHGSKVAAVCRRRSAAITWKSPRKLPAGNLKEYRVTGELELAFPKGTTYTVQPTGNEKCANDRLHGTFTTTTDNQKVDLWMYASESFSPACWSLISYVDWDLVIQSPPAGEHLISLGQGVNGGPYTTSCESWYRNSIACTETKALGLKISR